MKPRQIPSEHQAGSSRLLVCCEDEEWRIFLHFRGQQACLVCPEANEKECKNCKLIKKAETKNHHQIILGNHEFSGKRLEEKSEKGKRYHRKCERGDLRKLNGS